MSSEGVSPLRPSRRAARMLALVYAIGVFAIGAQGFLFAGGIYITSVLELLPPELINDAKRVLQITLVHSPVLVLLGLVLLWSRVKLRGSANGRNWLRVGSILLALWVIAYTVHFGRLFIFFGALRDIENFIMTVALFIFGFIFALLCLLPCYVASCDWDTNDPNDER